MAAPPGSSSSTEEKQAKHKSQKKNKKNEKKKRHHKHAPRDDDDADAVVTDQRFVSASTRPQFKPIPSSRRRSKHQQPSDGAAELFGVSSNLGGDGGVEIDERFKSKLTNDPRFALLPGGDEGEGAGEDRYGRRRQKKEKKKKKKKKRRDEDADDDAEEEAPADGGKDRRVIGARVGADGGRGAPSDDDDDESSSSSSDHGNDDAMNDAAAAASDDDDGAKQSGKGTMMNDDIETRMAYLAALSRGEISASSSSSEDDDDDDEESSMSSAAPENDEKEEADSDEDGGGDSDDDSLHGKAGVLDPSSSLLTAAAAAEDDGHDIELTDDPSPYLAILNTDWNHVRAVDLFVLLSSFATAPGAVKKVTVYPSDFGLERMKIEETMGPSGLWKKDKKEGGKERDDEDGAYSSSNDSDDDMKEKKDEAAANDEEHDEDDEEEDALDAEDAVSQLYSHFPSEKVANDADKQTDYDPEKLRSYEASKLKYFFAIAEFSSPSHADVAYKEVDGMELEHSSAPIDLRSIPPGEPYEDAIRGRSMRDAATCIPSNYEPPNFIVSALQQTNVRCTWEDGDDERERKLTRYGVGTEAWAAMTEGDDLRAYLASDHSSDEEEDDEDSDNGAADGRRGGNMRKLLGLGSDSDDNQEAGDGGVVRSSSDDDTSSESAEEEERLQGFPDDDAIDDDEEEVRMGDDEEVKEVTFVPGKKSLEEKIRSKIQSKQEDLSGMDEEKTPWQKYLDKRKEKRRERRQAARKRRKGLLEGDEEKKEGGHGGTAGNDDGEGDDGMYGYDPEFGVPESDNEEEGGDGVDKGACGGGGGDAFFLEEENDIPAAKKKKGKSKSKKKDDAKRKAVGAEENDDDGIGRVPSTKAELELLIAGDNDEEALKDYDMRGLLRIEKNAGKKLKGKRKRKEAKLAENVSGADFKIDTKDDRFSALLEGDDERFGIDRTDPNFKETPAMREVLAEQSRRRREKKRARTTTKIVPDVSVDSMAIRGASSEGALALSSLVKSLKRKVAKNK